MIRNILGVIIGFVIGNVINMSLFMIGLIIIPPPAGSDLTTPEGIRAALPFLEAKDYIFPFLAHAFGTLVGTAVALMIAATHKARIVMIMGFIFLLAGIIAALIIPAPMWFVFVDLVFAYTPMAWLAGRLVGTGKTN